jgi:hypothetical protein
VWDQVLLERKITQQEALTSLIQFASKQEPLVQTMLFGQVAESDYPELVQIMLRRLGSGQHRRPSKKKRSVRGAEPLAD